MADSDFMSLLLEETFKLQADKAVDLASLELKLKDYELSFLQGFYIPQSQVLRFKTTFGVMDIPTNWSVFSHSHAQDTVLTTENDPDLLFRLLKASWLPEMNQLLITHADGYCYLVGLKPGEEVHLHDLLNPQEWLRAA